MFVNSLVDLSKCLCLMTEQILYTDIQYSDSLTRERGHEGGLKKLYEPSAINSSGNKTASTTSAKYGKVTEVPEKALILCSLPMYVTLTLER
jgi:hypothetical protein